MRPGGFRSQLYLELEDLELCLQRLKEEAGALVTYRALYSDEEFGLLDKRLREETVAAERAVANAREEIASLEQLAMRGAPIGGRKGRSGSSS
jgi:hypothetical protein